MRARLVSVIKVAALAPAAALLAGCFGMPDACANSPIVRIKSPDGRHTAVMFQRDCGATTGFSTQVSILDSEQQLEGAGNVYRADDNHGAANTGKWGGPWAELQWLGSDHLLIRYTNRSRVFEQSGRLSGVRISYRQVER